MMQQVLQDKRKEFDEIVANPPEATAATEGELQESNSIETNQNKATDGVNASETLNESAPEPEEAKDQSKDSKWTHQKHNWS